MHLDTLDRRLRWTTAPKKERKLVLIERDYEIFRLLARYPYLRSGDISEHIVGKHSKKIVERLGRLMEEPHGFLFKPEQQWPYVYNWRANIYSLSAKGYDLLDETDINPVANLHRGRGYQPNFLHSMMICDVLSSIEIGIRNAGYRFITYSEILAKAPRRTRDAEHPMHIPASITYEHPNGKAEKLSKPLVPDALFGVDYGRSARYFALEADRCTEPGIRSTLQKTSYLRKLLQYQDIFEEETYKERFNLPTLMILHVTNTDANRDKIMRVASEAVGKKRYNLFNTFPTLSVRTPNPSPDGRMFTDSYKRVGYPDFKLSEV